jgi:hypothetical protein
MVTVLYNPPEGTRFGIWGDQYNKDLRSLALEKLGADSFAESFPVGAKVNVFYDPWNSRRFSLSKLRRLRIGRLILGLVSLMITMVFNLGIGTLL